MILITNIVDDMRHQTLTVGVLMKPYNITRTVNKLWHNKYCTNFSNLSLGVSGGCI